MLRGPGAGIFISVLALAGCLLMFLLVPIEDLRDWTREDAFFEIGSIAGYWIAALACLILAARGRGVRFHAGTTLLLFLLGARELDWHKKFTTASILKLNYYFKLQVPAAERLIALVIVIGILAFSFYYIARYLPPLIRRLRSGDAAAISVCCAVVILIFSKIMDRLVNILKDDYSLSIPIWLEKLQLSLEEPLELLIPVLVILALYQSNLAFKQTT
jgi:hypothetical protein